MSLRVYNTLSKQKELFEPVKPGEVGMYVCGPTVYKPPHMGHMVGPVIFDAVKRYLQFKGFKVTWIVNITDVDDKLIHEARERNTTVQQIADTCTRDYLECLALLGIDTIDRFPKASEHIGEIIALIEKLIAKGHAYASDGNVWFNVATDPDYGKLSHRSTEEQEAGTRDLEGAGKRNNADFALWKTAKPGEPMWDSPWGKGRPGWHIECSAMSIKYLGESFDIHGGGLDLQFPHHENELAQSESATDKPFAKYWMHNGLTRKATKLPGGQIRYDKESKSLGNVTDARELISKNGADFVRYLLLCSHYRSPIDNSEDVMAAVKKGLATFRRLFDRVERLTGKLIPSAGEEVEFSLPAVLGTPDADYAGAVLGLKAKFLEAMDDDFNTAGAIAALHELASEVNGFIERNSLEKNKHAELLTAAVAGAQTLQGLGRILGLFNPKLAEAGSTANADALPGQLMDLIIRLRQELRKSKNFVMADQLRKDLTAIGIALEIGRMGRSGSGNEGFLMRILGIDPGLRLTGYGVIDHKPLRPVLIDGGVIRLTLKASLADRLVELEAELDALLLEHKPDVCAVEQLYAHYAHPRTAILMGHARGVILLAARKRGIQVEQFPANRVKQSVTGHGHAGKAQMQRAIQAQWNLPTLPEPPDVADALAVALCCGMYLDRVRRMPLK